MSFIAYINKIEIYNCKKLLIIIVCHLPTKKSKFNLKNRRLKDNTKASLKGKKTTRKKESKTRGQKLSQLYNLQFDAVETCQSRPLEATNYCE